MTSHSKTVGAMLIDLSASQCSSAVEMIDALTAALAVACTVTGVKREHAVAHLVQEMLVCAESEAARVAAQQAAGLPVDDSDVRWLS